MKKRNAIALTTLAVVFIAGCASHQAGSPPAVPAALRPAAGETLLLVTPATGVQIYECSASKEQPTRFEWVFKAPEAELFDPSGRRIGKHYGGPTWESNDGSTVVGQLKSRDDGPDPNAIPWLLLSTKSTLGTGIFSRTRSIQRVDTIGGKAPTTFVCDAAQAGSIARVPYRATYYVYGVKH